VSDRRDLDDCRDIRVLRISAMSARDSGAHRKRRFDTVEPPYTAEQRTEQYRREIGQRAELVRAGRIKVE
jgi:hypothetical protein